MGQKDAVLATVRGVEKRALKLATDRGAILKWVTPAGTWPRTWEVVPATQLFPAAAP